MSIRVPISPCSDRTPSANLSRPSSAQAQNAYHTLDSLTFALPSGTVIDTAAAGADAALRAREPALAQGLLALKAELEGNAALAGRIRAKYRMKNTVGYSLNAFLDFDRPLDIFRNLLVGSEGTLAFIAEAVLRTVPDLPVKVTGFLLFPDIHAACRAIVPLRDAGAAALELMDRATLRSVQDQPGIDPRIRTLPAGAAALLAEFQAVAGASQAELERAALEACRGLTLLEPAGFTRDAGQQAAYWKIRQGTFPSVGAIRARGTSVITKDVVFPLASLAEATLDLNRLFAAHGYDDAIVFGHAKDGNIHFVLSQSFNGQAAVDQYARFMEDVVELVVRKYDGALKAEHGTGRNMAPFVETEWGPEATQVEDGPHPQTGGGRGRLRRIGPDAPGRRLLRLRRGPGPALPRTHRQRHPTRGAGGDGPWLRRPLLQQPHLRDRGHPGHRPDLPELPVPPGDGDPGG